MTRPIVTAPVSPGIIASTNATPNVKSSSPKVTFPVFVRTAYEKLFSADQRQFFRTQGRRVGEQDILQLIALGADIGGAQAIVENEKQYLEAMAETTYRHDRFTRALKAVVEVADSSLENGNTIDAETLKVMRDLCDNATADLNDKDRDNIKLMLQGMLNSNVTDAGES
jgi:hypothetical protein